MIRMIKGTYGLVKNGTVEPMTKHSPAFSINAAREAELVEAGVAVYEAEPESTFSEYNGLNIRARKQREPQQDDPPLAAKGDELRRDRRRSDPDNNKLAEQLPAEDPRIFASQCSISRANGRPFGGLIKFI